MYLRPGKCKDKNCVGSDIEAEGLESPHQVRVSLIEKVYACLNSDVRRGAAYAMKRFEDYLLSNTLNGECLTTCQIGCTFKHFLLYYKSSLTLMSTSKKAEIRHYDVSRFASWSDLQEKLKLSSFNKWP